MRAVLQLVERLSSRCQVQVTHMLLNDLSCVHVQDETIWLALCNKLCSKPGFYEAFGFVSCDQDNMTHFNDLTKQLASMEARDVVRQLEATGMTHLQKIARQVGKKLKMLNKKAAAHNLTFSQLVQSLVKSTLSDQLLLARLLSVQSHMVTQSKFINLLEQLSDVYSASMVKYLNCSK
jgi:hypothetical protein